MINLDKADRYFDEVFALLEKTGTTNLIVMKGGQPAAEVKAKFGQYLDKVIYKLPREIAHNVRSATGALRVTAPLTLPLVTPLLNVGCVVIL